MNKHGMRAAYYIVSEGVLREPDFLAGPAGCPMASHGGAAAGESDNEDKVPAFKFDFMFKAARASRRARSANGSEKETVEALRKLGGLMNQPPADKGFINSTIPAGYTYLGQLIAHEITFDNAKTLSEEELRPELARSPSFDLDSLYGDPQDPITPRLYDTQSPARLNIGKTYPHGLNELENDLPRDPPTGKALIGDKRNDENLAIAQMHVALIKFHNKVVDALRKPGEDEASLLMRAREAVTKHFQWIVLKDFLPRIVNNPEMLPDLERRATNEDLDWCREHGLYMPLEFSAAAFRLGHSMVRGKYQWNLFHSTELGGPSSGASLNQMFGQTQFSGDIGKAGADPRLRTEWIIDWRRFFKFPEELGFPAVANAPGTDTGTNLAKQIDTKFDLHLDAIATFNHDGVAEDSRSITVRNLLRGHALGLPSAEEVARALDEEVLGTDVLAVGEYRDLLSGPIFKDNTPLWFYILREAEKGGGNRLGPVGSRIVAEVLVGIIRHSPHSILVGEPWFPQHTSRGEPGTKSAQFAMVDLLHFAGVVNSLQGM